MTDTAVRRQEVLALRDAIAGRHVQLVRLAGAVERAGYTLTARWLRDAAGRVNHALALLPTVPADKPGPVPRAGTPETSPERG